MKIKTYYFVILICLIIGCDGDKKILTDTINPISSLSQLSDSSYVTSITCIIPHKNKIYFSDYKDNRIIILNKDYTIQKIFGRAGSGPGEFKGAHQLYILNDSLFVIDEFGRRVNIYTLDSGYTNCIALPPQVDSDNRFAIDMNGNFYLSSAFSKYPITEFDNQGNVILTFGKWYKEQDKVNKYRNGRNVHICKNKLITIGKSVPIIDIYSLDGHYQKRIDLSHIKELIKILDYQNSVYQKKNVDNISLQIFYDSYIYENRIYILYLDYDTTINSNQVLVCEIGNKWNIEPKKVYALTSSTEPVFYQSICIYNPGQLVAFNRIKAEMHFFDLNEG